MKPTPSIIIDLHTYQVLILENFYSFIRLQEYPIPTTTYDYCCSPSVTKNGILETKRPTGDLLVAKPPDFQEFFGFLDPVVISRKRQEPLDSYSNR